VDLNRCIYLWMGDFLGKSEAELLKFRTESAKRVAALREDRGRKRKKKAKNSSKEKLAGTKGVSGKDAKLDVKDRLNRLDAKAVYGPRNVKEGWLRKAGRINTSFKPRYVRVYVAGREEGAELAYFRKEEDWKPAGVVRLFGADIGGGGEESTQFVVETKARKFVFRADTVAVIGAVRNPTNSEPDPKK
jgi:hypothetical protein